VGTIVIRALRIPLFRFLIPFFAFALAWMSLQVIHAILRAIASILSHVPLVGGLLARAVKAGAHAIHNGIGYLALQMEHAAVGFLLAMAVLVDQVIGAVLKIAYATGHALAVVRNVLIPRLLRASTLPLRRAISELHHLERWIRTELIRPALHRVNILGRLLDRLYGQILRQLRALWHAIATTVPIAINLPRIGIRDARAELARLWKALRAMRNRIGLGVVTGALFAVLARLGLNWIRCRKVNRVGRTLCGVDSDLLDSLLADLAIIGGAISLVEFARECQGVMGVVDDGLHLFVREL